MLCNRSQRNGISLYITTCCSNCIIPIIQGNIFKYNCMVYSIFGRHFFSIDYQSYIRAVGVYGHDTFFRSTVHETFTAHMDHRLCGPVCLINIESVFLCLTIIGYETLVVTSLYPTLIAGICSEVKHVPYMSAPQIWTGCKGFQHFMVVICCILFGIIMVFRCCRMPFQDCFGTIFRYTERTIRV